MNSRWANASHSGVGTNFGDYCDHMARVMTLTPSSLEQEFRVM